MNYRYSSVWDVVKRFLIGWAIAGVMLVMISCVKFHEFIGEAFENNMWAIFNALMPSVIIILGIGYLLKSAFGRH